MDSTLEIAKCLKCRKTHVDDKSVKEMVQAGQADSRRNRLEMSKENAKTWPHS